MRISGGAPPRLVHGLRVPDMSNDDESFDTELRGPTDNPTVDPERGRAAETTADPGEDRPLGISLLTWLYWFWTGATVLFFLSLIPGDEPVPIGGRTLSRSEALARVLPVLLPMGLAALGAALALTLQRSWARPAILLPVVLAAFGPALSGVGSTAGDVILGALAVLPVLAALVWYLYFRPRTTAYFRQLNGRRNTGP